MDAATQKMIVALGSTVLRKVLTVGGTALASHGLIAGNQTEMFVSGGLAVAGVAWSFWNDYGREIVVAQLEVWKAKALAQQEAMRKAKVPEPTHAEIAAASPDPAVTPLAVAKVVNS